MSGDANAPHCEDMCSRKEFDTRLDRGQFAISVMERDAASSEARFELAVCRYEFHRGGAGASFVGGEMRTLRAMHKTLDHCRDVWMQPEMVVRAAPAGYVLVYKVLHDVCKAISSDMAFLRRHYPPSLAVANVFERCLRMALDAHYRVAEDLCVDQSLDLPWAAERLKEHGIPAQVCGSVCCCGGLAVCAGTGCGCMLAWVRCWSLCAGYDAVHVVRSIEALLVFLETVVCCCRFSLTAMPLAESMSVFALTRCRLW
eukprot:2460800-Rhodomonas_salina.1